MVGRAFCVLMILAPLAGSKDEPSADRKPVAGPEAAAATRQLTAATTRAAALATRFARPTFPPDGRYAGAGGTLRVATGDAARVAALIDACRPQLGAAFKDAKWRETLLRLHAAEKPAPLGAMVYAEGPWEAPTKVRFFFLGKRSYVETNASWRTQATSRPAVPPDFDPPVRVVHFLIEVTEDADEDDASKRDTSAMMTVGDLSLAVRVEPGPPRRAIPCAVLSLYPDALLFDKAKAAGE